jgi:hypothetical protein
VQHIECGKRKAIALSAMKKKDINGYRMNRQGAALNLLF